MVSLPHNTSGGRLVEPGSDAGEATYRCRAYLFGAERVWRLTHDALIREGRPNLIVRYDEIRRIRFFNAVGVDVIGGGALVPPAGICSIKGKSWRRIFLTDTHMLGLGRFENRSATFQPFMERLIKHAEAASPSLVVVTGMPRSLWWIWAGVIALYCGVVALALGIIGMIGSQIIAGWRSGHYRGLTFNMLTDGLMAVVVGGMLAASIVPLVRALRHSRQRVAWPPRRDRQGPQPVDLVKDGK